MSTVLHPARESGSGMPAPESPRGGDMRLSRQQVFIVATLALGIFFDSVELMMTNVLATVFSADTSVSATAVSRMLAALFVGGAIGAPIVGRLADRYGRRPVLRVVIAAYAVLSVACALSANIGHLTLFRFLSGMVLAGLFPLAYTYMAETLPPQYRGRMGMLVGTVASLAAAVTPLLTRLGNQYPLFGLEGWRMTLLAAGHGGALVFLLALRLPETTRWLQRHAREPSASHFDRTAGGSGFAARLALLLTLQMLLPLAVVGFTTLSGVVMRQRSIDLHGSLLYLAVAGIGAPLGSLTASLFVDRIARQRLYAGGCLAVGVLCMAFAEAKSVRAAMAVGGAFLFTLTIVINTLSVYGPEMFGTARRGFATGLGYAAFRAVAALVPLLLLPLLLSHGAVPAFAVMAGAMVVSAALVLVFGPRGTAGRVLE